MRNRKRPKAPSPTATAKDFVSITISVIALAISGVSMYFAIPRQSDELSMVVGGMPMAEWVDGKRLAVAPAEFDVTFINSGTRSIVVKWLYVDYAQPIYDDEGCARFSASFETDLEPLVVREKEVVVRKYKVKEASNGLFGVNVSKGQNGTYVFPLLDHNLGKDVVRTEICAALSLITRSSSDYRAKISVRFTYATPGGADAGSVQADSIVFRPRILIREPISLFGW